MLVLEAKRWIGVTERGGNNRGEMVEMFQKAIGRAINEPWCMSFVQFCCQWPDYFVGGKLNVLHKSEHCFSVWMNTKKTARVVEPFPGCVAIWQYQGTTNGHTGIVESYGVDDKRAYIISIEGNTSDSEKIVREGDGVFLKKRFLKTTGKMRLKGFLNPWPPGE